MIRRLLLGVLFLGMCGALYWQLNGGVPFEIPEGKQLERSPEPSSTLIPSDTPDDMPMTISAMGVLQNGMTATAVAKQTVASAEETSHTWQITEWARKDVEDSKTSTAIAVETAYPPTATAQARQEENDARQAMIQPIWDWSQPFLFWICVLAGLGYLNHLVPALAARIRPHADHIAVPIERDDDEEDLQDQALKAPEFRMTINTRTGGGMTSRRFTIPCSPETFVIFCARLAESKFTDFSEATWVRTVKGDTSKLFSARKFHQFRTVLLKEKLIVPIKTDNPLAGFAATPEGISVFERAVEAQFDGIDFEATTPPP